MSFSSSGELGTALPPSGLRLRAGTPPASDAGDSATDGSVRRASSTLRPTEPRLTDDLVARLVPREPWPSDIATFAKMREIKNESAHVSLFGYRIPVRYSSSTVTAGSTIPSISRMAVAHFSTSGLSYGSAIATNVVNMAISLLGVTGTPDVAGQDERILRNLVGEELKVGTADAIDEETQRLYLNDKADGAGDVVRTYGKIRGKSDVLVRLEKRDGSVPAALAAAMRESASDAGGRTTAPAHPTRELYSVEQLIGQRALSKSLQPPLAEPEELVAETIEKLRHPFLESELPALERMLTLVDDVNQRRTMPLDRAVYEAAEKSSGGELSRRLPRPAAVAAPEIVVHSAQIATPLRPSASGEGTVMATLRRLTR